MNCAQKQEIPHNAILGIVLIALLFVPISFALAQEIPPPDESHVTNSIGTCGMKHFEPRLEFCDTRDNQIYRYVTIGTQIWMAENLNYGTMVPGKNDQAGPDQKYCFFDKETNCDALYQWSEALGLDSSFNAKIANLKGKVKGICPDGWHIPHAAEWETLLDFVDKEQGKENENASLMSFSRNNDFKWKTNTDPDNMMPKDKYGFAVVATGHRVLKGTCPDGQANYSYFCNAHDMSKFWTSDDDSSDPQTAVSASNSEEAPQFSISSLGMSRMTDAEKKKVEAIGMRKRLDQSDLQRSYKDSQKYQGYSIRCVKD